MLHESVYIIQMTFYFNDYVTKPEAEMSNSNFSYGTQAMLSLVNAHKLINQLWRARSLYF